MALTHEITCNSLYVWQRNQPNLPPKFYMFQSPRVLNPNETLCKLMDNQRVLIAENDSFQVWDINTQVILRIRLSHSFLKQSLLYESPVFPDHFFGTQLRGDFVITWCKSNLKIHHIPSTCKILFTYPPLFQTHQR